MADPHATPQQEQVRRLLADARHTGPVPPDVAGRLDDALAGLVAERAARGSLATAAVPPADELARRRRRRIGAGLLAAAAAVVVGVALPGDVAQVATLGGSESSSDSGSGDAVEPEAADGAAERSGEAVRAVGPVLELDGGTPLRRQLREVPGALAERGLSGLDEDAELRRGRSWCPAGDWGRGDVLPARYDGVRAVLVRRAAEDGRRRVDLYVCGEDEPRRTATLRAP